MIPAHVSRKLGDVVDGAFQAHPNACTFDELAMWSKAAECKGGPANMECPNELNPQQRIKVNADGCVVCDSISI